MALRATRTDWVIYAECDMVFGPSPVDAAATLQRAAEALLGFGEHVVSIVPVYQLADDDASSVGLELLDKSRVRTGAGLKPCSYHSHKFMDYEAWESSGGVSSQLLDTPKHWVEHEALEDNACAHFEDGLSSCPKESIREGWVIEPYFIANRHDLPEYDEMIEFGTWDKIDQIKLMGMCSWRFSP